ncbi:MAG: hydrolase [Sulfobacillus benefaciens]|uniref:Hydrolase n=1 Tax=Sulfobacillus benefaciens TaxID=453960 RepID=A0A2T2WVG4_9FIRM|nr:MAG: hydrolase [Sulfobacillus benefaciens]HBQ96825.1 hydrolase [Sulfobacillus sp.]
MNWMDTVPLWDHHCHLIVGRKRADDMKSFAYALSEAPESYPLADIQETVVYWRALAVAARELGTEVDATMVQHALKDRDFSDYASRLLHQAGYNKLLVDTGFVPPGACTLKEMEALLTMSISPIFRIERAAEAVFSQFDSVGDWIHFLKGSLKALRAEGYVGVKSIVAYRSGLNIAQVRHEDAQAAFECMKRRGQNRLTDASLLNYLLWELAPILIEETLPIQFHTGYGDRDMDLSQGNPLLLRNFLETFTPHGLKVLLLHTYPYHREAGYLASVYPAVYFDVSLALPLAASGSRRIVAEALELAPASRFLFASDAHSRPESFALAAQLWRESLKKYCEYLVTEHHLLPQVVEKWVEMMAWQNCRRVYQI